MDNKLASGHHPDIVEQIAGSRDYIFRELVFLLSSHPNTRSIADDFTQDTMVLALKAADQFRGEAQISKWLMVIAENVVRGHFRRKKQRARLHLEIELEGLLFEEPAYCQKMPDPIARKTLANRLKRLKGKHRTLVLMHAAGLTYKEMQDKVPGNPSTLSSHVHNAHQILRQPQ